MSADGPARSSLPSGTPAVVCIAGLGDGIPGWSAVMKEIAAFVRVYTYERSGLGLSELPKDFKPDDKAYRNIAKELKLLLEAAKVKAPYVLIMHSMGGLPGREFLDLYPDEVAGMVFVDTVTENNYKTRPKELPRVMRGLQQGLDDSFLWEIYKPAIPVEELKRCLSEESNSVEHKQRLEDAIMGEVMNLIPSSDTLAEKKQFETSPMGNKPVSIIKGDAPGEWRQYFEQAVATGKGTEEDRKMVGDYLATADGVMLQLQFKQLRLSNNSRLVEATRSWHNVHWYRPDLIAKETKWCIDEFAKIST